MNVNLDSTRSPSITGTSCIKTIYSCLTYSKTVH